MVAKAAASPADSVTIIVVIEFSQDLENQAVCHCLHLTTFVGRVHYSFITNTHLTTMFVV